MTFKNFITLPNYYFIKLLDQLKKLNKDINIENTQNFTIDFDQKKLYINQEIYDFEGECSYFNYGYSGRITFLKTSLINQKTYKDKYSTNYLGNLSSFILGKSNKTDFLENIIKNLYFIDKTNLLNNINQNINEIINGYVKVYNENNIKYIHIRNGIFRILCCKLNDFYNNLSEDEKQKMKNDREKEKYENLGCWSYDNNKKEITFKKNEDYYKNFKKRLSFINSNTDLIKNCFEYFIYLYY